MIRRAPRGPGLSRATGGARRWSLASALLVAVALLLAIVTPGQAQAHALLVRSDPPINAALRESPTKIRLFMSEPLQRDFSGAEIRNAQGVRVDFGETAFDDLDTTAMSVPVPRLEAGIYTVVWNTLSSVDGHTWNGSFSFTILNADGSAPLGGAFTPDLHTPGPSAAWDAAVKWVTLSATLALAGFVLFALLIARPAARALGTSGTAFGRRAVAQAHAAARVAVILLFVTTGYDAASAAAKLGGLEFLDEILFDTRTGVWLLVRWSLLLVASAVLLAARRGWPRDPRPSLAALVVVSAGLIATLASVSHGAAIDEGWIWATLFDAIHLAAAAVWVGVLAALVWLLWRSPAHERGPGDESGDQRPARRAFQIEAVRRFSLLAAGAVPILAVAGLLSLLVQVPAFRGFTDTDWGTAMIVKLILLALLLTAAAANALLLRPRAQAAGPGLPDDALLQRRFRRLMRAEVLLAIAVVAAAGTLTQLPSPRSELPSSAQKLRTIEQTFPIDDLSATLRIEPNLVGINTYTLDLAAAGSPADSVTPDLVSPDPVTDVRFQFRYLDDPAVGGLIVPAQPAGDGRWTLEGAFFGLQGNWAVDVELRRATRDDAIAGLTTIVEQGYLTVLPFGVEPPSALALPVSQIDWDGIGALWAAVIAGLFIAYRGTLRRAVSQRAADIALASGTTFMAVTIILLFSVEAAPGRTIDNPVQRTPESVSAGATIFADTCAPCHGATGGGDGPLAGTLPQPPVNFRVHVPFHPDGTLYAWITQGIAGTAMQAFSDQLTDQERWDLVNFLRDNFDRPLAAQPAAGGG